MSPVEHKGKARINLRVDPDQVARLRSAAEANGESLTGFLLAAGAERAEAVLDRASRVTLGAMAFERFVAALGHGPEPMPTLARYASEPGPITSR